MSNIPTPHIGCDDPSKIANTVLMPGDPLRARYIAENFLTDVTCFNEVRGMLGFTGFYGEKRISVMGSGMGMPSAMIYYNELFDFYDVGAIIRHGRSHPKRGAAEGYHHRFRRLHHQRDQPHPLHGL